MDITSVIFSSAAIFFGSAVVVIGGSYIAYKVRNKNN